MVKFDFNDTSKWEFEAIVYVDSSEEFYESVVEWIVADILDGNNFAGGDVDFWDHEHAHKKCTKNTRYDTKGTCDHCGAHFNYGAAFKNTETGEISIVGNTCASSNLNLSTHEYADKKLRKQVAAARHKIKADHALEQLKIENQELYVALTFDNNICKDVKAKFRKYLDISDKQEEMVINISKGIEPEWMVENRKRAAAEAKARACAKPVPTGRHTVEAIILGFKFVEGYAYDTTICKMIVQTTEGWKAYGSLPAALEGAEKGDVIKFAASFQKSKDDEKFGFFKRPTKAEIIEKKQSEAA